jgi:oligosaccharide repeat unit polymerase
MSGFPFLYDPMKLVYYALITILLWSYWRALKRARDKRTPFTPIMGWLVGLGYFVVVPLTILVLHDGYQIPDFYEANARYASIDLSDVRYLVPMLVIWLSLLFAFQSVLLLRPRKESSWKAFDLHVQDGKLRRAIFLTLGLSILDCVFTVWRSGGLESFLISHWYLRQKESFTRFGDIFVLYAQMSLANQIVFTSAAALFTARQLQLRRKSEWRFFMLIGFGLALQMAMSGNRIFIALYGLSFLTACWIYQRKRLIAAILLLLPLVLLFFSAWASFRHDLSSIAENLPGYVERDIESRAMTTLMDTTEGSSVMQLMHMINDFGDKFNYFYGSTYSKAVTFLVPRALYPNKPENYPVQIAKLYEPGEVTSLGTTQLGELYANFGVFAVLLLPFITVLILLLSAKLARKSESNALLLAVLFLLLISLARTSFEDNFITFLFSMLLVWGLRLQSGFFFGAQGQRSSVPLSS